MAEHPEVPESEGGAVETILARDSRYSREAYSFLMASLQHTVEKLGERRHVSGQELLGGVRDLARERFGMMAPAVFRAWGIRRTEDFGRMVFNLVEAKVLSKRPEDSIEDFREGFDFGTAFEPEYDLEPPSGA
ncbi:MAG TPA: hypothetical protein PK280_15020 [Planctomycetota bacterium]|nr:hypothetical protein [Planctomycetota bacterium]